MISSEVTDTYNALLRALDARGRAQLSEALERTGLDKNAAVRALSAFCEAYTLAAATVSAMVYNALAKKHGYPADAVPNSGRRPEATEKAAYAILSDLTEENAEPKRNELLDRFSYENRRAAGHSMLSQGDGKVRFARVPQGTETCDFCMLLAATGFVYTSADTALYRNGTLDHYHANCDCVAMPSFGEEIEGYDPQYWADVCAEKGVTFDSLGLGKSKGKPEGQAAGRAKHPKTLTAENVGEWKAYLESARTRAEVDARFQEFFKVYKRQNKKNDPYLQSLMKEVQKAGQAHYKGLPN